MQTVNSLSGGKTSSYIAANYPADFNVFSLVRTDDRDLLFPDEKIRKVVSEKIGREFIGTLEDNDIIYTMLDLEQYLGQKINWISGMSFDEVLKMKQGRGDVYLPNKAQRFCTVEMKIKPIFYWCAENTDLPVEMRIGFRSNEQSRATTMIDRCEDGIEFMKATFTKNKNGTNHWEDVAYRKPVFPLIDDGIFKDNIEEYWKGKPVRFAYLNNCVGCFNRNEMLLKHMSNKDPKTFEWFAKQERDTDYKAKFKTGTTYDKIKSHKSQHTLFDDDFNECDSGYCGL